MSTPDPSGASAPVDLPADAPRGLLDRHLRGTTAHHNLAAAQAYLARPLPAAGDGFLIDPDHARQAVRRLDTVIEDLTQGLFQFMYSATFPPPGRDEVSIRLAENAVRMAARAEEFIRTWIDRIQAARDALSAQIEAYQQADRDVAP